MPRNIESSFRYHAPKGNQQQRYEAIRAAAKRFAAVVLHAVPDGEEKEAAILQIRQAGMMANAGIACGEENADGKRPFDPDLYE